MVGRHGMNYEAISALGTLLSGIGTILLVLAGFYAATVWRKQALAQERRSLSRSLLIRTKSFAERIRSIRTNFKLYPEERDEIQRRMDTIQKQGGHGYDLIYDGVLDRLQILEDKKYHIEDLYLSLLTEMKIGERDTIRKLIDEIFRAFDDLYATSRQISIIKHYQDEKSIEERNKLLNDLIGLTDPNVETQIKLDKAVDDLEAILLPYIDMRK